LGLREVTNKENLNLSKVTDLTITKRPIEKEIPTLADQTLGRQAAATIKEIKSPVQFHLESEELQNLKKNKVDFFPAIYVSLHPDDEKFLFDLTVQLKYGDASQIHRILHEGVINTIKDFPIESFLFQGEFLQELFALMKKSTEDIQYQITEVYIEILKKILKTIHLYQNPHHKNKSQARDSEEFIVADDKPYIKNSYPTLNFPTPEVLNDEGFKKHQRDTFPYNYFLTIDGIIVSIMDLCPKTEFIDNINTIWRYTITIFRKFKLQAYELIQEAVKDYQRRFIKKFEEIGETDFFENLEYAYISGILYNLFRMYSIEEYEKMEKFNPNAVLSILVKGIYKFAFTEREVDDILTYLQYLNPELHSSHLKCMALLTSVLKLKSHENNFIKARFENFVKTPVDFESFVDLLEKILLSIPYASFPNFVELYCDAFLYSQVYDHTNAKELYERCRDMILSLLHLPNASIRVLLLESIVSNLNSDAKFSFSTGVTRRALMFQSLLDEELMNEIVFSSIGSDLAINCAAKIVLNFLSLARDSHLERSKIQNLLNFSTLFYTITNDPSASHETLKAANNLLWKMDNNTLLKILLSDLFSRNHKRRISAFKTLISPKFIRNIQSGGETHEKALKDYEQFEKKLKDRFLSQELDEYGFDPLKKFLDTEMKTFYYKDVTTTTKLDIDITNPENLKDIENLLNITVDFTIEPTLRMSALEQLGEYLQTILRVLGGQSSSLRAFEVAKRICGVCIQQLLDYSQKNILEAPYITKILSVLNRVVICPNIPREIAALIIPLYDYNSNLFNLHSCYLLHTLLNMVEHDNSTTRYHALLFLNSLVFYFPMQESKLPKSYKPSHALTSLQAFEKDFFIISQFDQVEFESAYQKIWKIFPLENHTKYFIDMHLNNVEKLKDPNFSVQDFVLDQRCKDFISKVKEDNPQSTDSNLLLKESQRWAKLVMTLELYLPSALFNVDIFMYLTKVLSGSITLAGMRNGTNISKITALLEKLFKSPVFQKELQVNQKLLTNILEFIDFFSSTVLAPLYELNFENAREKLDIIFCALRIVTRLLDLSNKAKQPKIKLLVVKKIVKQPFLDLLENLSTFFNNNEILYLLMGKLCRQIFKYPEIYLVVNTQNLIANIFDFMFQCTNLEHFRNKHIERWFLKFFLDYTRLEEDAGKVSMKSLSQSFNKLSDVSKANVLKASTLGWLLRIAEDRETFIRISTWNLMSNLATRENINNYQSSIETGLQTLYAANESFGVVLNAIHFLNKTLDLFMNEAGIDDAVENVETLRESMLLSDRKLNETNKLTRAELSAIFFRKNILSHLKMLISNPKCPPLYLCNLAALLRNVTLLNPQRALPVLTQLEFWDLLVDVINPKTYKNQAPNKNIYEHGKTLVEIIILVNNITQFLIFSLSYDRQIGEYLIYCTQLLKVLFKWLRILCESNQKSFISENPGNVFLVDSCAATLVQLFNSCLFLNPDKTLVIANKIYEDKIEKSSKESKYNIYLMISILFSTTKSDTLILSLFKLVSNLLPQWKKGLHMVESQDRNGEALSESLILNLFSHFKLNEMVAADHKIPWDDYCDIKAAMISCTCALLSTSNPAKLAFICSGFLTYCLKNMAKAAEFLLIEDLSTTGQSAKSKSLYSFFDSFRKQSW